MAPAPIAMHRQQVQAGLAPSAGVSGGCYPDLSLGAGEVEKPSGVIRANSCPLHPLTALSDRDQHRVPAVGTSSGSGAVSRCEQEPRWQPLLAPADGAK
ncbi:hypothetical protein MDA_GLEAN10002271 [Myotis davidii]|uniref:Uncharacterized protein n=1 Tax=Myotis davidii TaxID=225400 RepID=L5LJ97_MYODS|nr:hypothetical protein MDA_GLEAN10002271 [Myotis davidii]